MTPFAQPKRVAIIAISLLLSAWALGPYFCLRGIESAIGKSDAAALAERIDFDALRANLKMQLAAQAQSKVLEGDIESNPLAAVAAPLGTMLMDQMIDSLISPYGVMQLLKKNWHAQEQDGVLVREGNKARVAIDSWRFTGLSGFEATLKSSQKDQAPVRLVLHQDWLAWRLVDVVLPSSQLLPENMAREGPGSVTPKMAGGFTKVAEEVEAESPGKATLSPPAGPLPQDIPQPLPLVFSEADPRPLWETFIAGGDVHFDKGYEAFLVENYPVARKHFQESAMQAAKPGAQLFLGAMYSDALGTRADYAEAARWLALAASQKLPQAAFRLARLYERGQGVPQSNANAHFWMKLASEHGLPEGQFGLGTYSLFGVGTPKNELDGYTLINDAARQGYRVAQRALGHMLLAGSGVRANAVEGAQWMEKAALGGDFQAQLRLAECYREGQGVVRNLGAAYMWFDIAKARADNDTRKSIGASMEALSVRLEKPRIEKASRQAESWLQTQAEELQRRKERVALQVAIEAYRKIEYARAFRQLNVVAHGGRDPVAMTLLGTMYRLGYGTPQDMRLTFSLYSEAAEANVPHAQYYLGQMYAAAAGVPENSTLASQWLEQAAKNGPPEIQYQIAAQFLAGRGIQKDAVRAYAWANLAATAGEPRAPSLREEAAGALDGAGIARAQDYAATLRSSIKAKTMSQALQAYPIDVWIKDLLWFDRALSERLAYKEQLAAEQRFQAANKQREEEIKRNQAILKEMQNRYRQ